MLNEACCKSGNIPDSPTIGATTKETSDALGEALRIASNIDAHLFGPRPVPAEHEATPDCLKSCAELNLDTAQRLVNALARIYDRI